MTTGPGFVDPAVGPDDAPGAMAWDDAMLAAACIAVDPVGLGGVRVRAAAGPVRDAWLARWRSLVPPTTPIRNVPLHVDDGRLVGGIDLAASLRSGRPVEQPGLLAQLDGGYAILSMAERIDASTAARIASVVETRVTSRGASTRIAIVALDEGDDQESLAPTLIERLALCIDLRRCAVRLMSRTTAVTAATIVAARVRLERIVVGDEVVEALCTTAHTLGIDSLRMPLFAVRVARVLAALDGRDTVDGDDAARAARLVFASRVRRLPDAATPDEEPRAEQPRSDDGESDPRQNDGTDDASSPRNERVDDQDDEKEEAGGESRELDEAVLDATRAAIPADLLASLARGAVARRSTPSRGSGAGAQARGGRRGAPVGIRRGRPRAPERLSLVETLRAAAPWQRIRRAERPHDDARPAKVLVRADDLHVVRFRQRNPTTTVFVVDASGSAALHRLAEAKGAVELLLADCYVRRDSVAVLAFRGTGTQVLLPPTRSLVRARRSLAGLPGGGGTPLADALDATREMVVALRRRGDTVLAVLLTDGRANVARDGSGGRPQAEADALAAARSLRAADVDVLLIDTSPRPHPLAERLADEMGALYRPLPHADAGALSSVVQHAVRSRTPVSGR